jgi:hypothetical protein
VSDLDYRWWDNATDRALFEASADQLAFERRLQAERERIAARIVPDEGEPADEPEDRTSNVIVAALACLVLAAVLAVDVLASLVLAAWMPATPWGSWLLLVVAVEVVTAYAWWEGRR